MLARNIWNKEIVWCRNARRIQAGEPMTVKEMEDAGRTLGGLLLYLFAFLARLFADRAHNGKDSLYIHSR